MKIIYTRPDGGVSVVCPAHNVTVEELMARSIPADATNVQVIEDAEIPADRTFRDAWKQNGSKVEHDVGKAKEIAHAKRRRDRADAFKPLDIEATIPGKAAQAEAKRQAIRDKDAVKQAAIDAAATVEELKILL